jgi:hypothetical protein
MTDRQTNIAIAALVALSLFIGGLAVLLAQG